MAGENIQCCRGGFLGSFQQLHPGLFNRPPPLTVIARCAGCDQVLPGVDPPQTAWDYVVYGQVDSPSAAVLAGVLVSAEDFTFVKYYPGSGAFHHSPQTDDRWFFDVLGYGLDGAATVHHHTGFASQDQPDRAAGRAHVDGRKVGI